MDYRCKSDWLKANRKATIRSLSLRGLVSGVGVNDADYMTTTKIDGLSVRCPAYSAWKCMLNRCYSEKSIATHPTYSGVKVCSEWLMFECFRAWWLLNFVDGWEIDKDIIGNGDLYSSESCIFVPSWLNSFTLDCGSARGEFPIGACFDTSSGSFVSRCMNPKTGSSDYLGRFSNPIDAHNAWLSRKLLHASDMKNEMDEIDLRIYDRVVAMILSSK